MKISINKICGKKRFNKVIRNHLDFEKVVKNVKKHFYNIQKCVRLDRKLNVIEFWYFYQAAKELGLEEIEVIIK